MQTKIESVLYTLLWDFPGYLRPLGFIQNILPRAETITLAIGAFEGKIALYFNHIFVEANTNAALKAVLMHELAHVLLRHCFTDSLDLYPNRKARLYAEETCANEIVDDCGLGKHLPGKPIRWQDFPYLVAGQSTHERYEAFNRQLDRGDSPQQGSGEKPSSGSSGSRSSVRTAELKELEVLLRRNVQIHDEDACSCAGPEREELRKMLDGNDGGQDSAGRDPGTKQGGDPRVLPKIPNFHANAWGAITMPWRTVVRVGTRKWPSRRFPQLVGIVPGRRTRRFPPRIAFAIDTSGSLNAVQLAAANLELNALAQHAAEIQIIHCDKVIHKIEPYTAPLETVFGGGGTDLRPPFEEAKKLGVDALVYFTDADGLAPPCPPLGHETVWLLSPGATKIPPWGRTLQSG